MSPEPFDGTAIVLHLIEAARAWAPYHEARAVVLGEGMEEADAVMFRWVQELEERYAREQPKAEPVGWEPRTWGELVAGDRVTMGGVEAEVVSIRRWHVDPRSSEYRPVPLESVEVRLKWGTPPQVKGYPMPAAGEVETLRGPAGLALDEANGYRSLLAEEPINVMESWAADAAATLEAAGLGPVEVLP